MRRWGWFLVFFALFPLGTHADTPVPIVHVWANGEPLTVKALTLNKGTYVLMDIQPLLTALGFSVHRSPRSSELFAKRGSAELTLRAESRWGRWKGKRIELVNAPLLKAGVLYAPLEVFTALNLGIRWEHRGREHDIYLYDYLPNVDSPLHAPAFWVKQLPNPDTLIAAGKQLAEINRHNYRAGIYTVWEDLPETIPPEQGHFLAKQLPSWDSAPLYDIKGRHVTTEQIAAIRANMNLPDYLQPIPVAFGLTIQGCLLRGAPRDDIYTVVPGSLDFDELQVSSLEIGFGVAVIGRTRDGAWLLLDSPFGWGWVEREFVAIAPDKASVQDYRQNGNRLVVIGDRVSIQTINKEIYAPMGTDFPILRHEEDSYIVKIPERAADGSLQWAEGRIADNERVRVGFLPFTPANVIRQSCKMLGEPYAWGDQRQGLQGRDCSRFIADVFRSMGVILPRNSYEQDKTGVTVLRFTSRMKKHERLRLLANLTPSGTILSMKGHVMIYLGAVDAVPYAIHALYAYRTAGESGERKIKTNRVVISRLELGENTKRRSLLERLTSVVEVGGQP